MTKPSLDLEILPETLAVCRLPPQAAEPDWARQGGFHSVTRTDQELSIVCAEDAVPSANAPEGLRAEKGWRALRVAGPLDFALTGILASLAVPLAEAGVPIFALSTFDTDVLLVRAEHLPRAAEALTRAGHALRGNIA